MASSLLERGAAPLDGARRAVIGGVRRSDWLFGIVARRDRRLTALASAHALLALALSVLAPPLMLVLGPVLLGVAHVGADLRYLVLRRALPRAWLAFVWGVCALLLVLRGLEEAGWLRGSPLLREHGVLAAWLVVALASGVRANGSARRAVVALPLVLSVSAVALWQPSGFRLVFAHLHNLVALVLWLALFRGRIRGAIAPIAVVLAGAALCASGVLVPLTVRYGLMQSFGLHLYTATDWIAPGLSYTPAVALTVSYAFLQSVHYAVWLLIVPQEDSAGQGTLTFSMSARGLLRDFGGIGLVALGGAAALVLAGGVWRPVATRNLYLSLATFHGYLELALFVFFWVRGDLGRARAARPTPTLAAIPASAVS